MTLLFELLYKANLATALTFGWLSSSLALADDRPNILYIMADDHAAHAISAYGGRLAEVAPTPNIDRLAHEAILLENVFCTNAICTPSRASILIGQYGHVNGVYDLGGKLAPENQTLPHELKKNWRH